MSFPALPAGLESSDTIDVNFASSSSPPPMQYDQWSAADTDDYGDIRQVTPLREDLAVTATKITTSDKTEDVETVSPTEIGASVEDAGFDADGSSVHSAPAVRVAPSSPSPMTARSTSSRADSAPSTSLLPPSPLLGQSRRNDRRSTLDARTANRLSGFFSFMHRRDAPAVPTTETSAPVTPAGISSSRASSPPPSRPTTPPPRLPPPTLPDLGLTLSSITQQLSASSSIHTPCSGALLSPHYLLLCHAQGLDVLPLVGPPTPQPYALIRRVPFKSVVVMEHRGVLVAIAGRRDGVRVYALEEIRRAVEWRIEAELRREHEKARREGAKRPSVSAEKKVSVDKEARGKRPTTPSTAKPGPNQWSDAPPLPRSEAKTTTDKASKPLGTKPSSRPATPIGPPPAYTSPVTPPRARELAVPPSRSRSTSVNEVLAGNTLPRRHTLENLSLLQEQDRDAKADWASSDDEAINVVAAPSGSQMLDERTSSMTTTPSAGPGSRLDMTRAPTSPSLSTRSLRRNRPSNLDLSLTRTNTTANVVPVAPPSPAPTLLSLQQALTLPPMSTLSSLSSGSNISHPELDADDEDDGDVDPSSPSTPTRDRIGLADILLESRLPDVAPVGTRVPQQAIMIGRTREDEPTSPRTSESVLSMQSTGGESSTRRRRRRWSVLGGVFTHSPGNSQSSIPSVPEATPAVAAAAESSNPSAAPGREEALSRLTRSASTRIAQSGSSTTVRASERPSTSPNTSARTGGPAASIDIPPVPRSGTRFLPRIITNALQGRRSDDTPTLSRPLDDIKRIPGVPPLQHVPAPKLEYVKLPGTKSAVMIKAVETAKKSFLAILCGENGEKVELFAGTYRTALGLSRTFILPDSPRSLELQLQGDDLVEVFLVFSQNVFGLEPATVRVREVRIGRAERRAARRRAREQADQQAQDADSEEPAPPTEETTVNVTVLAAPSSPTTPVTDNGALGSPPQIAPGSNNSSSAQLASGSQAQIDTLNPLTNSDELNTVVAAQSSPYTTFQQLGFAPSFPLASIADDYVIPPTYLSFLEYRNEYEPDVNGGANIDLSQVQFSPPGLPIPAPAPPSKWYYRDPKGLMHGPWKASLMQAWYKDGLLPPDLPVRREEESEYVLLKDLRSQCLDPTHPFRSSPAIQVPPQPVLVPDAGKPLLAPISLLSQPKHFGPPALFYSSRGGHSTTIVDARGRSVLRGRFLWTKDEEESLSSSGKLGDVLHLEAFDVCDRSVLVAMRQGGLEAVDFGDALLRPADLSRTAYPHFQPPHSSTNRRGAFIWKIGTPLTKQSSSSSLSTAALPSAPTKHRKKQSTGPSKAPGRVDSSHVDGDASQQDEVLFLGRRNDELYFCERRTGSFRILRLAANLR